MRLVNDSERVRQLKALAAALEAFLPTLEATSALAGSVSAYEQCLAETNRLLAGGFTQDDLSALSRAVPRLFWLHKEWTPHLEQGDNGGFSEPAWFKAADALHEAVQNAAEELRVVGRY
jgi:hypothetical protein